MGDTNNSNTDSSTDSNGVSYTHTTRSSYHEVVGNIWSDIGQRNLKLMHDILNKSTTALDSDSNHLKEALNEATHAFGKAQASFAAGGARIQSSGKAIGAEQVARIVGKCDEGRVLDDENELNKNQNINSESLGAIKKYSELKTRYLGIVTVATTFKP